MPRIRLREAAMSEILSEVIARNRAGQRAAIPSVCTAHPEVLTACLLRAEALDRAIVVEATSNQVNQDGGYTGMTPVGFAALVHGLADRAGVARGRIVLGGDHLGPQAWRKGTAEAAMAKARVMVADYVAAGFAKIHLDCSEGCAGEAGQLDDATAAARAADLALACEAAAPGPVLYVIGTEVPPPGGARAGEDGHITPTTPASARATLAAHRAAFAARGLDAVLPRIGGLVVQPGVEFAPMAVHRLPMARDPGLLAALTDWPLMCLEAHSTDYQHPEVFPRLADLGFAFQKVGPALTFAWREAIYALDCLAGIAGWRRGDSVVGVMEALMLADPHHWQGHYRGDSTDLAAERHFGLADRIRYYWPRPEAQAAVSRLLADLEGRRLPEALLAQVLPGPVLARAETLTGPRPLALARAAVQLALDPYFFASER
jgi:D-tagatose-1,6-bisphosphate aldolase subunit GatZ/KbaZ